MREDPWEKCEYDSSKNSNTLFLKYIKHFDNELKHICRGVYKVVGSPINCNDYRLHISHLFNNDKRILYIGAIQESADVLENISNREHLCMFCGCYNDGVCYI